MKLILIVNFKCFLVFKLVNILVLFIKKIFNELFNIFFELFFNRVLYIDYWGVIILEIK